MKYFFIVCLSFLLNSSIADAQNSDSTQSGLLNLNVKFHGASGEKITKEALMNSDGLFIADADSNEYRLTGCKVTVVSKGYGLKEFSSDANAKFTPEIREYIKLHANSGTKIFLEYIRCRNKKGISSTVKAMQLIVE